MSRALKILWINRFCLADTSSGAAMAARDMLTQLSLRGANMAVLGMTCFDKPVGRDSIQDQLDAQDGASLFTVEQGRLTHNLIPTRDWRANEVRLSELDALYKLYHQVLGDFEPDLVWFFGGHSFDMLIPAEAKRRGVKTVAYVPNGSYMSNEWCRDVDLIVTETNATAQMYKDRVGFDAQTVGVFIEPEAYVAKTHSRTAVTFVNPVLEKGGGLVAQLAIAMEEKRPDIPFHIVESRGRWDETLEQVQSTLGKDRRPLTNVKVIGHTNDMRPVYAESRVHLVPSLWWEGAGRVVVEAMLNGIPTIVTNRGGPPELMGNAGFKLDLKDAFFEPPYGKLLPAKALDRVVSLIERIFDDEDLYADLSAKAFKVGETQHSIKRNGDRLNAMLRSLCAEKLDQTV